MTKTINDVYMQLFRRLKEGGDPMPLQYRVPPELIMRGSTCAVRA